MNSLQTLTERDREMFRRFRITDEVLSHAAIRRVDHAEAATVLGRPVSADLAGLLFPYLDGRTGRQNSTSAVRRDNPPIGTDGKPQGKYLFTAGRSHLYLPPDPARRMDDVRAPLVIVESQKGVLALECLFRRTGRVALPVGINGCWGWTATIGKTVNADGVRVDEKGVLPDLKALLLPHREAVVMLDSNVASNPKVRAAEKRLIDMLKTHDITVRVARVPSEPEINGPDDLLAAHGDSATLALIDGARDPTAIEDGRRSGSAATNVLDLVHDGGGRLFHSQYGTPYLSFPFKGREEIINLRSPHADEFLATLYWRVHRRGLPQRSGAEALNALRAEAKFDGPQRDVFLRVARLEDAVVLDLGQDDRRVVVMTREGWTVSTTSTIAFDRPRDQRPLPVPVRGGDLRGFLSLFPIDPAGEIAILLTAWLVNAIGGTGAFPLLHLVGEQGSGKSLCARLIKRLIDDDDEPLRSGSSIRDAETVGIAACNSRVIVIDNLSHISGWFSDVLCAVSTGGVVGGRELYTNTSERRLKLKGPTILTSINKVVSRPDLLERTLSIDWPLLTDARRRDEQELYREFERVRPEALGAICTAVCAAMRDESEVVLPDRPRLADFARFATAAERALNIPPMSVYAIMRGMREVANRDELDGSVIGTALRDLCEEGWTGTPGALIGVIEAKLKEQNRQLPPDWPKSPKAMGDRLRQWAAVLRHCGYQVRSAGHREDGNAYELTKASSASSGRSADSAANDVYPGAAAGPEHSEHAEHQDASQVRVERDGASLRFSRSPRP
jgi:hypothetical protein